MSKRLPAGMVSVGWEATLVPVTMAQVWGEALGEARESARGEPGAEKRWGGGQEGKGALTKLWGKGKVLRYLRGSAEGHEKFMTTQGDTESLG